MNADFKAPRYVIATLDWRGARVVHQDSMVLPASALQADAPLAEAAARLAEGPVELDASRWLQPRDQPPARLPAHQFRLNLAPVPGRHYPRMAFASLATGPRDLRPCRILALEGDELLVDVNHPLAPYPVALGLAATDLPAAPGRFLQLVDGPGMQVPPALGAPCYLPAGACRRQDESGDAAFYAEPRLVHHLDSACRARIAELHGHLLRDGMAVLDLMSSWVTHLPARGLSGLRVTGLGMNAGELDANPDLAHRVCQDLNRESRLPFSDGSFHAVLCSASVEYLVRPRDVLAEVLRVLRPGGVCVITFSDRWFPPKAIRVWSELHPYERQGLVSWLMVEAGFVDLHTFSLRGLSRPGDDKYAAQRDHSDPLFAVWGRAPAPP